MVSGELIYDVYKKRVCRDGEPFFAYRYYLLMRIYACITVGLLSGGGHGDGFGGKPDVDVEDFAAVKLDEDFLWLVAGGNEGEGAQTGLYFDQLICAELICFGDLLFAFAGYDGLVDGRTI